MLWQWLAGDDRGLCFKEEFFVELCNSGTLFAKLRSLNDRDPRPTPFQDLPTYAFGHVPVDLPAGVFIASLVEANHLLCSGQTADNSRLSI